MDEQNPTIKERQIYHEMKLTPAMVKSIRTLCGVCLRHYVETKAFKIAIVPNKDRCMETCTVCQTRRGYDYVVMPRRIRFSFARRDAIESLKSITTMN